MCSTSRLVHTTLGKLFTRTETKIGGLMKIYLKVISYVMLMIAFIGMILPFLISSDSWIGVSIGIAVAVLLVPFSFFYIRWSIK